MSAHLQKRVRSTLLLILFIFPRGKAHSTGIIMRKIQWDEFSSLSGLLKVCRRTQQINRSLLDFILVQRLAL